MSRSRCIGCSLWVLRWMRAYRVCFVHMCVNNSSVRGPPPPLVVRLGSFGAAAERGFNGLLSRKVKLHSEDASSTRLTVQDPRCDSAWRYCWSSSYRPAEAVVASPINPVAFLPFRLHCVESLCVLFKLQPGHWGLSTIFASSTKETHPASALLARLP